jgi:hypothetical protein
MSMGLTISVAFASSVVAIGCRNGSPPVVSAEPSTPLPTISALPIAPAAPASPPPAASVVPSEPNASPSRLAQTPEEVLACRTDADCIITCRFDGSCCTEQCGCSQPMSRAFAKRLERHLLEECGKDPICPVASCVGTKKDAARCERGQCVAKKLPGSA